MKTSDDYDALSDGTFRLKGERGEEQNNNSQQKSSRAEKPRETATNLICMADVQAETVSWLWYPYIPIGKLTILEGDPGVGKSWVSLAMVSNISQGVCLPLTEIAIQGNVLLASAEDGLGDTIRPRLDALKANVSKIYAIEGALDFKNGGLATLESCIQLRKPILSVIDPLTAYLGSDVDFYRANETRPIMAALSALAANYNLAILVIRHLTKGSATKSIYRGLGSIDITAAARSVLLAGQDPEYLQKRAIVQIKSNLAANGKAIGYEIKDQTLNWTGESDLTAQRILSAEGYNEKSAIDEAVDFLREELAAGPMEWRQIDVDSKAARITDSTLRRAREKMHLKLGRSKGEPGKKGRGPSVWELSDTPTTEKDLLVQDAHIEKNEQVNQLSFKDELLSKTDEQVNPSGVTADERPDYPTTTCYTCGGRKYWLRPASHWGKAEWLCLHCHPKPRGDENQ